MSGGDTGRLRAYNEQIAADDPRLGCELNKLRDDIDDLVDYQLAHHPEWPRRACGVCHKIWIGESLSCPFCGQRCA